MLSFLRVADKASGRVGLSIGSEGVAIAEVHRVLGAAKPKLVHCSYAESDGRDAASRAVRGISKRNLPTVSVLPSVGYQLLLVEAPEVPPEELRAAIRWRIKDLIDYHIDDAVIDVFQMPSQGRGGTHRMMYAIAAKAESVKAQVATVEAVGLKLDAIDILELSLRNVAAALEENGRGIALLHLGAQSSILLLLRQGVMYLTRRVETGIETLTDADAMRSELIAGLALEARRSLDYFESHYEQDAISVLYTSGLNPSDQDLLAAELSISVRNVSLASFLETDIEISDEVQRQCLPAIGAALRKNQVAL